MSDEHRRDALGCAGHPIVRTPNIDALAARGVHFQNAYTPSPMCVPTRAAVACGDHVHKIGYWDSATPYEGSRRSWMHQLRNAGVHVTSIGKLHFRSGDDDNGFSEEILPMHVVGGVGWAAGLLRANPPNFAAATELARDVGAGNSSYTDYDLSITAAAEDWLQRRQYKPQPWAAFVSLVSPHYPLTAPEEFYDLYNPADMPLPTGYSSGCHPTHPEIAQIARFFDYNRYFDEQKTQEAKAAYFGLVSFMDNCVGRIMQALHATGQEDNTVVIYVSDHGEMLGDLGLWTKQVMYEASAGIPMIAAGPGIPEGKTITTGTTLLDLYPTALDVTGVPQDEQSSGLPGISIRATATQKNDQNRTIFSEYHDGGSSTGAFMARWKHWKYVYYPGQPCQLFNLQNDPNEFTDLAEGSNQTTEVSQAISEGKRRLLKLCDPEAVNRQCFADQSQRIQQLGGERACRDTFIFNHTPAPK